MVIKLTRAGYTGEHCQEPTNPCTSSPCVHGGTCSHNGTVFKCACPEGLSGTQCEHHRPVAPTRTVAPTPCGDVGCVHGVCVRKEPGAGAPPTCFCEPGYGGPACDREYDECASNPCEHGATCEDLVDAFLCRCRPGYEGPTCSIKVHASFRIHPYFKITPSSLNLQIWSYHRVQFSDNCNQKIDLRVYLVIASTVEGFLV